MNGRINQIGFSQRIRLEWFEQTTQLVLAGNDSAAVKDSLQNLLQDKVSIGSRAVRGNRVKVITILMKTWLTVPAGLEALRDEGLNLFRGLNGNDRIALHWGIIYKSSRPRLSPAGPGLADPSHVDGLNHRTGQNTQPVHCRLSRHVQ